MAVVGAGDGGFEADMAVGESDGVITVAVADPFNAQIVTELAMRLSPPDFALRRQNRPTMSMGSRCMASSPPRR